jgi:hypothetical protein
LFSADGTLLAIDGTLLAIVDGGNLTVYRLPAIKSA